MQLNDTIPVPPPLAVVERYYAMLAEGSMVREHGGDWIVMTTTEEVFVSRDRPDELTRALSDMRRLCAPGESPYRRRIPTKASMPFLRMVNPATGRFEPIPRERYT